MRALGTIREFRTKHFTVIMDALPELDLDLSWDDTGEVAAKLDSGEFVAFVARCRVLLHGNEIGSDYLGGCVYESIDAFMDHRECGKQSRKLAAQGKNSRCGSYFADMIHTAIAEARKYLIDMGQIRVRQVR